MKFIVCTGGINPLPQKHPSLLFLTKPPLKSANCQAPPPPPPF